MRRFRRRRFGGFRRRYRRYRSSGYGRRRTAAKRRRFGRKVRSVVRTTKTRLNRAQLTLVNRLSQAYPAAGGAGTAYFGPASDWIELTSLVAFSTPTYDTYLRGRAGTRIWIDSVVLTGYATAAGDPGIFGRVLTAKFPLMRINGKQFSGSTIQTVLTPGALGGYLYQQSDQLTDLAFPPQRCFHWPLFKTDSSIKIYGTKYIKLVQTGVQFGFAPPPLASATALTSQQIVAVPGQSTRFFRMRWKVRDWFDYPAFTDNYPGLSLTPLFIPNQCKQEPAATNNAQGVGLSDLDCYVYFREQLIDR